MACHAKLIRLSSVKFTANYGRKMFLIGTVGPST
jgi:hypothetical protein